MTAPPGRLPFDLDNVLEAKRYAVQRTQRTPGHALLVCTLGRLQCLIAKYGNKGIQLGIKSVDPVQIGRGQFTDRIIAPGKGVELAVYRLEDDVVGHRTSPGRGLRLESGQDSTFRPFADR